MTAAHGNTQTGNTPAGNAQAVIQHENLNASAALFQPSWMQAVRIHLSPRLLRCLLGFVTLFGMGLIKANESGSDIAPRQGAGLSVIYPQQVEEDYQQYLDWLTAPDGLDAMIAFVNDTIQFQTPLAVNVDTTDGPLYDPQIEQINLPLTFLEDIESRFEAAGEQWHDSNDIGVTVMDVVMHTLFHEVGHALIAQYGLPVVGREEDGVDGLANVLLLEYIEDGDQIASSAADMFALEDLDYDEYSEENFWAEHSLDIQRYYSTYCHIYGSDPEEHEYLIDDDLLSEERAEQCEFEYQALSESWHTLLEPYLIQ